MVLRFADCENTIHLGSRFGVAYAIEMLHPR